MASDRIEKSLFVRAPLERVWRALSDSTQFGHWFGMRLDGPFAPGASMRGTITPTMVDAEVAAAQRQHEGLRVEITIERIEPMHLFSFRWHPFAIDPQIDYSSEPTTLIEFTLSPLDEGVQVTVVESGFDRIPLTRRLKAFSANEGGWGLMVPLLERYVTAAA